VTELEALSADEIVAKRKTFIMRVVPLLAVFVLAFAVLTYYFQLNWWVVIAMIVADSVVVATRLQQFSRALAARSDMATSSR
jgi:hypothetical protein